MALLNPYLQFNGTAAEAMSHYQSVLGGELTSSTFAEAGMAEMAPPDQLMHSQLVTPAGFTLMAADVPPHMESGGNGTVSISGNETELLTGYFTGLADGGTVVEPLVQAPWGDQFGMLVDRFGVAWMVNITAG